MRGERGVQVGGQLGRHSVGKIGSNASGPVDAGELPTFGFRPPLELATLDVEFPLEELTLRLDRDVFAGCHRERPGQEPSETGEPHEARPGVRACESEDETDVGDETIAHAEHRCSGCASLHVAVVMVVVGFARRRAHAHDLHQGHRIERDDPFRNHIRAVRYAEHGLYGERFMGRFDLDRSELAALLSDEPSYRVDQVWQGVHTGREIDTLTSLPSPLRARLSADPAFASSLRLVHEAVGDGGDTVKWLFEVDGGARIETVLMHHPRRTTVCISSQAGCAMACGFCATGQAGFDRHLSVGEIVEQVVRAQVVSADAGRRLSNVVFMGMGEPFANYDRVWAAVTRIHSELGLSARHITLSTVGVVPGIDRLAGERLPVSLAVSLHAASDALRDELVPLNRRYPLAAVADACARYLDAAGRRLSFEWALIRDVNDSDDQAELLAGYARQFRLPAHVNLIPLNPTDGFATPGSSPARVRAFRDVLRNRGVNVTVRRTRGVDIDAACGQLRSRVRG